jgi:tetratricopeptide (TPR) repeat protein
MKKNYRFYKYAVIFLSVTVVLVGCNSKENFVKADPHSYHQGTGGDIHYENVNKFLSSIKKVDGEVEAKYRMARYFQKKKRHKIAIAELKEVILMDPFFVKAYNALGVSYDQLWDYKNAIHFYKLAIKMNPDLDYVHNNLGFAYLLSGDYDRAIEAFHKAIALNEHNNRFHNNLGFAYAKKGEYELALAQFKLTGDESSANYKLGQILYKEGKSEIARKYSTKSFQAKSSNHVTPSVSNTDIDKGSQAKIIRKSVRRASGPGQQQEPADVKKMRSDFDTESVENGRSVSAGIPGSKMSSPENNNEVNNISKKEYPRTEGSIVEVEIEIENGNGVDGMANRLGNYLRQKGFKVTRAKNANCFSHEITKIFYYSSHAQDVSRLLQEIPGRCGKKNLIELKHSGNHIKILIGKDMIPYNGLISGVRSVKKPS